MLQRSGFLRDLAYSETKLESALIEDPTLINAQDENGMTILHHFANSGSYISSSKISAILKILFNNPDLDFTIKDQKGNTPLHCAALRCNDPKTFQYIFPAFLSEAARRGFDFSTLGEKGETVLHIATQITFSHKVNGVFERMNNVRNVLNNVANPGLNVLSSSGSTAFCYAVYHGYIEEANLLLDAGANPSLYGAPDRNPFALIDDRIVTARELLNEAKADQQIERFRNMLEKLITLKKRMLFIVATEKSASEVNKNAMMLSLGNRDNCSFFKKLPSDMLTKIAGLTATNGVHTQETAEDIAAKHFVESSHKSDTPAFRKRKMG